MLAFNEKSLTSLTCRGFNSDDHWGHRAGEPNKAVICSLALARLRTDIKGNDLANSNAVGMAQKLLLFWRKPARRCWWEGIELEDVEGVEGRLKVWIRRVWTLEMVSLFLFCFMRHLKGEVEIFLYASNTFFLFRRPCCISTGYMNRWLTRSGSSITERDRSALTLHLPQLQPRSLLHNHNPEKPSSKPHRSPALHLPPLPALSRLNPVCPHRHALRNLPGDLSC